MRVRRQTLAWACEHTDKPNHVGGECAMCYMRKVRKQGTTNGDPEFRHPELILGFIVQKNCTLCGDGMPLNTRECQLHPSVCDACEREYCECQVVEQVDLSSLEEITRLPEEARVGPLMARKITLRCAGKNTNSVPAIPYTSLPDTVYVPFRQKKATADDTNPLFENVERTLEESIL